VRADQKVAADALLGELSQAEVSRISFAEARRLCPILRDDYLCEAIWDGETKDIDVATLHAGFLRMAKVAGADLHCHAPVSAIKRIAGGWHLETPVGEFTAAIVINAAGAWADKVAELAGVSLQGLTPKRRTAMMVEAPFNVPYHDGCMVVDVEEQFYLKPEARLA